MRTFQLNFFDHTGSHVAALTMDQIKQFRYTNPLNDVGGLQFTIPLTKAPADLMVVDTVCTVYFSDTGGSMVSDGSYFLRQFNPLEDGGIEYLVVGGYSMEYILRGNIFIADDDPLVANGFSTKSGNAAPLMREIVVEQCISPDQDGSRTGDDKRAIPNLVAPAVTGGSFVAFREESSDTKIIDLLKKLGRAGGVDFWVEYDPSGPYYTVRFGTRGSDKRKSTNYPTAPYLYYAPQVGNIAEPNLEVDRGEEGNYVYVFGQGPAGTNLRYGVAGQGVNDSPWNRKEFGVQARNTKTLDDWETEAANALAEARAMLTRFSFKPQFKAPGAMYYDDWVVGDLVTASYQGQEFEMRITEAETNVSENDASTQPKMELI